MGYGIGSFSIQMKQFYRTKDTEKLLIIIIPNLAHKSDGLILQLNKKYKTKNINYNLKWKPKTFNSIDLLLKMKKKESNSKTKSYALLLTINDTRLKKINKELFSLN